MKLGDLSEEVQLRLKNYTVDYLMEKHEGFNCYNDERGCSFLLVNIYNVLIPIPERNHPNITILKAYFSHDNQSLTLILKDMTDIDTSDDDWIYTHYVEFVLICEKFPGEDFFVTIFFHCRFPQTI
jgi:hypothetical protein